MIRALLLAALVLPLAAAGCASSAPTVQAEAGVPFRLALGETAALDGHTIRFAEVVEDSRCPEGAQCVWAGRARIAVTVDGQAIALDVPHAGDGGASAEAGGLDVAAQALEPAPSVDGSDATPEAVLVARPAR